jgi:hypothetical protein
MNEYVVPEEDQQSLTDTYISSLVAFTVIGKCGDIR